MALGLTHGPYSSGNVNLNLGDRNFSGISGTYDATRVIQHEVNEVLGLGSVLGQTDLDLIGYTTVAAVSCHRPAARARLPTSLPCSRLSGASCPIAIHLPPTLWDGTVIDCAQHAPSARHWCSACRSCRWPYRPFNRLAADLRWPAYCYGSFETA